MIALIPSFMRCGRVRAIEYAERIADRVIISTQTADDYEAYRAEYGSRAEIVYGAASSAAGNRNTLLRQLSAGERAIMLDDDVRRVSVCYGPRSSDVREATRGDIERCFDKMEEAGIAVGGFYPVNNPFFAFPRAEESTNDILIGAGMLFIADGVRFDESYGACEDYALVLKAIVDGGTVMRFNHFLVETTEDSMSAALAGRTSGGLADAYAEGKHAQAIRKLAEEYWPIARLGSNGTSIQIDKRYVS